MLAKNVGCGTRTTKTTVSTQNFTIKVMPLVETESLVLKSYNLAEADRIVVFFTREQGIVRGVAKGAKRLKSKFGSTLEPFSAVNLTYFHKEERELVSIQNVELKRSYFAEAADPEFLTAFSHIVDILMAFVPPHDPNEKLYRMISACLEAASEKPDRLESLKLYFELWLLRLGGYLPEWTCCRNCSRPFSGSDTASLQSDFHLLCRDCQKSAGSQSISGVQIEVFQDVQKLSPASFADSYAAESEEINAVSVVLRRIISHVIGRDVVGDKMLAARSY